MVTLLAILELVKEQLIDLVQSEAFAPIHLKAASSGDAISSSGPGTSGPDTSNPQ